MTNVSRPLALAALPLLVALAACGHPPATQSLAGTPTPAQPAPAAAVQRDPQNPLIGVWRLSGYTPNGNMPGVTCQTQDMTFTATQTTQVSNGVPSTMAVTYVPAGTAVYVMTDAGVSNAVKYLFHGADDMEIDAILGCRYHRVG